MLTEHVILVDENDKMLGTAEKMVAHQKALLHRAFSVFIYHFRNNEFELLLQQRHSSKYHSGGLWTNTCCSHPRPGESVLQAAKRRLKEEMNLSIELHPVGAFKYKAEVASDLIEHEFDHVLIGFFKNEKIDPSPYEVQAYRWASAKELMDDLNKHPELYTSWLKNALLIANEAIEKNPAFYPQK